MTLLHTATFFAPEYDISTRFPHKLGETEITEIEVKILLDEFGYYQYTVGILYENINDGGVRRHSLGYGRNFFAENEFTRPEERAEQVEGSTGMSYDSLYDFIELAHEEYQETVEAVAGITDHVENDPELGWVVIPNALTYGDYTNSLVEKSNHEVFLEEFGDREGVVPVSSAFNCWAIAITAKAIVENEDIVECLNSLQDYPLINDEKHSELCLDEYWEMWEQFGQHDFVKELCKVLTPDHYGFDDLLEENDPSSSLLDLYEKGIPSGEYYIEETGGICLKIEESVSNLTLADLAQCVKNILTS